MFKNVAAKFIVFAFDATTNVPKTGDAANLTAYVSKDYGAVTVLADTSASEMDATNAPGYYLFDAAQGETNADCLMVSGKSSTANIKVIGAPAVIYTRPTTGWLAPATAGRTLVVDASGLADANVVKLGPTGSGTAQTARDIGASVLLSSGTGTGQLDFTSGVVKANVTQFGGSAGTFSSGRAEVNVSHWLGTAAATPTVAGVPEVDVTHWLGVAAETPATLTEQSAAFIAAIDNSESTLINSIKEKTDQLTFGTANRVDAQVYGMEANTLTASALASDAVTEVQNGLATAASLTTVGSDVTAIKTKTDDITFSVANKVDANIKSVNDVTVDGVGTEGNPWGPA